MNIRNRHRTKQFVPCLLAGAVAMCAANANADLIYRGNGLVYDTVLDITWLQDAGIGGATWDNANDFIDNLNATEYLGFSNWRLPRITPVNGTNFQEITTYDGSTDQFYAEPNGWFDPVGNPASEMGHLFYVSLNGTAICEFNTDDECVVQNPWGLLDGMGPFTGIVADRYWYDQESTSDSTFAWTFNFGAGGQQTISKGQPSRFWPVRDGDVPSVVADIDVSPSSHAFGLVAVGNSDSIQVTITNTGDGEDLTISNLDFSGSGSDAYSISGAPGTPFTIEQNDNVVFDVLFAPNTGGNLDAALEVSHNAPNVATPVTIEFTGEGDPPPPMSIVYVNGDWTTETIGANVTFVHNADNIPSEDATVGIDAFASLQSALTAVDTGGIIYVAPGTYADEGQVVIDKAVRIFGPNAGLNPSTLTREPEATFTGEIQINPKADDIVISGLRFSETDPAAVSDGNNTTSSRAVIYHGSFSAPQNFTAGSNFVLAHNIFENLNGPAIFSSGNLANETKRNWLIHQNIFDNNAASSTAGAIQQNMTYFQGFENLRITQNVFSNVLRTAVIWTSTDGTFFVRNEVDGTGLEGLNIFSGGEHLIVGNTFRNTNAAEAEGRGALRFFGASIEGPVKVANNLFEDNNNAILIRDSGGEDDFDHDFFEINHNTFSGNTGSAGGIDFWDIYRGDPSTADGTAINAQFNYSLDAGGLTTNIPALVDFSNELSEPVDNTDTSGNGLTDIEEAAFGTDPALLDTDGDGIDDFTEVMIGSDPLTPFAFSDSDNDRLPDFLDPFPTNADSSGNGVADGFEYSRGANLRRANEGSSLGDLNDDGVVDLADALIVFRLFLGLEPGSDPVFPERGDVNLDGGLSNLDGTILINFVLENIETIPAFVPQPGLE